MSARELVQPNFSSLKVLLSRIETSAQQTFDGQVDGRGCMQVNCKIDDALCAHAENGDEFNSAIVDDLSDEVDARGCESRLRHVAKCLGKERQKQGGKE